jgi:hypothetical protein
MIFDVLIFTLTGGKKMIRSYAHLSVLLFSIFLTACGDDDNGHVTANPNAYLRVLHASPDAPNVDILVDGNAVLTDVPFQAGSGYLAVTPGAREVTLRVSGTTTIALKQSVDLLEDGYYSVIAQNDVANIGLKLIDDTERFNNGTVDVSVAHASPGSGNVDIYVNQDEIVLPAAPTLANVPFDAFASLLDVANATYQIRLTANASTDVVYDSGALPVSSDITAVAVDSTQGASPATLLIWSSVVTPVLDNSSEVRIVHAVDAVDVDVFVGNSELLGDFSFKDTTVGVTGASAMGYLKVAAGSLSVAISAADQGIGSAIPTLSNTLNLERGRSYTVIAAGDVNDLVNTQLIVLEDMRTNSEAGIADVRLVHAAAAAAADPVDIYITGVGNDISGVEPNFDDVVIGQDTGYVALAPAVYDIIIAADNTKTAAVPGTSGVSFSQADIVTAIAVGNSVPNLAVIILNDAR